MAEVDERVDLDEENCMEGIDDDAEEQVDEDDADRAGSADAEEHVEEEDHEESDNLPGGKDQSPDPDRGNGATEPAGDEEKLTTFVNEEDREKHAQLLALPPYGSEVFIGGLPRDTLEYDLRDLCEPIGEVAEIRLVKDKTTGEAKGYAFVAFRTKEDAQKAIEELQSKEFKGKTLRCSISETKHRLFIGNVPKSWTEDEFRKIIEEVGPGIENIELIKDPQNSNRNRGFAFILYYNNACADYSRQKMTNANFKLDGNNPTVSWADPKSTPDHSVAAQVKALYVRNIPENSTVEQLKEIFQRHGEVTNVVMPPSKAGSKRDFGFVYYAERSSALKAVKDTEKHEIDGQVLEVVLAKPQAEKKTEGVYPYNAGTHQSHLPHSGYGGFAGNHYGSMGAGYGVANNFQQPMIYGRGPMPSGMQMVPMVLPDGRIGYVLQQPGIQMPGPRPPRRNDRSNGLSGGRAGSSGDEGNRGRRYRPY